MATTRSLLTLPIVNSLERALQASEQKTQEIFNSALAAIASMRVFENGSWTIDRVSAVAKPSLALPPKQ